MKLGTEQWRKIWKWAQTVQNTEPKRLEGDIAYYRNQYGVYVDIPVILEPVYPESKTIVSVLLTDDKRKVYPLREFFEFYNNPELVKIFYDVPIDATEVVNRTVFLKYQWKVYQPDWNADLDVEIQFQLMLPERRFHIWVGLIEDDHLEDSWNRDVLGRLLWETIRDSEL